jgi:alkylated DNA repair dioxygenase AlkB
MELIFESNDKSAFLSKGVFDDAFLLEQCIQEFEPLLFDNVEILVYGELRKQHRSIGFFSDKSIGYTYSKTLMPSQPLSSSMTVMLEKINAMMGTNFNGMLVNKYKNGHDCIGPHSDSTIGLDSHGVVAISYGAERTFRIRDKFNKKIVFEVNTTHNSIIQMGGRFQKLFKHEIPKQTKIKGCRFSITFRSHSI